MNTKYVILLLSLGIFGNTLFAQMSPPDFNAIEVAGLTKYDSDKVLKKLKITDDSIKSKVIQKINSYNIEIDSLLLLHAGTLENLEKEFDINVKIAFQNRDPGQMDGVKAKIKQIIPPIRFEMYEFEKVLNEGIAQILTEKENKKWIKYQERKKLSNENF